MVIFIEIFDESMKKIFNWSINKQVMKVSECSEGKYKTYFGFSPSVNFLNSRGQSLRSISLPDPFPPPFPLVGVGADPFFSLVI